jgi:hypothetical protein
MLPVDGFVQAKHYGRCPQRENKQRKYVCHVSCGTQWFQNQVGGENKTGHSCHPQEQRWLLLLAVNAQGGVQSDFRTQHGWSWQTHSHMPPIFLPGLKYPYTRNVQGGSVAPKSLFVASHFPFIQYDI